VKDNRGEGLFKTFLEESNFYLSLCHFQALSK